MPVLTWVVKVTFWSISRSRDSKETSTVRLPTGTSARITADLVWIGLTRLRAPTRMTYFPGLARTTRTKPHSSDMWRKLMLAPEILTSNVAFVPDNKVQYTGNSRPTICTGTFVMFSPLTRAWITIGTEAYSELRRFWHFADMWKIPVDV